MTLPTCEKQKPGFGNQNLKKKKDRRPLESVTIGDFDMDVVTSF
ncbi:MAG: hypothetical protein AAFY76_15320 [Cyanobacteria bacterium J06649_11]